MVISHMLVVCPNPVCMLFFRRFQKGSIVSKVVRGEGQG